MNKEKLFGQIVKVVLNYKEPQKIMLFGSRAAGNSKDSSDIDIAIFGSNWTDRDINLVSDNLNEEIETPLLIDVLNYESLANEKLRQNIIKYGSVMYESRKG